MNGTRFRSSNTSRKTSLALNNSGFMGGPFVSAVAGQADGSKAHVRAHKSRAARADGEDARSHPPALMPAGTHELKCTQVNAVELGVSLNR